MGPALSCPAICPTKASLLPSSACTAAHALTSALALQPAAAAPAVASGQGQQGALSEPAGVPAPSPEELLRLVLDAVRDLVGAEVDPRAALGGQGLDSLAAMELRQKLQVLRVSSCCRIPPRSC